MVVLTNYGNTCYFNSILQIFLHLKTNIDYKNNQPLKDWAFIINKLKTLKKNTEFKPHLLHQFLKLTKKFPIGLPHDAHHVFLEIIDYIQDRTFTGKMLQTIVVKHEPHNWYWQKDEFTSLDLSVNNSNTLKQCLDEFFEYEIIEDWKDEKDNSIKPIIKNYQIIKFPINLVIVLKQMTVKKKCIHYDFLLDMNPYAKSNLDYRYHLISVIIHKHSHYYTFCREYENYKYKWYLYNDEFRQQVSPSSFINQPPYMLIYTRIS
tara:strand:+ start:61 stop:846 length:786 start_codon:yes stop_codon:yes gene_type:complete